ncbi:MAG TPA: ABC transporter permease [Edaphobacter sp.]|nr:ABC transporter permease [Edaphobacter sp.]
MPFHNLISGIKALFHKDQRSRDMDEELLAFQQASAEEKIRSGLDPHEAQRAARIEMGSPETVKEKVRSSTWESTAQSIAQDIRYSLRVMAKNRGFTAVAILSLALGIGANTAIFTLIDNLILKSLPVSHPEELVAFGQEFGGGMITGIPAGPMDIFAYDFYQKLQQQQTLFQGIAAFSSFPSQISVHSSATDTASATQAVGHLVSGNFFSVLGANPLLGRAILPADAEAPGRNPVAVVSYRYWQQSLAANPSVIGSSIVINGVPFTVIGVMPANFYGVELDAYSPDMWLPLTMQVEISQHPTLLGPRGLRWLHFIGRTKPGTNIAQLQAWVTTQTQQYLTEYEGQRLDAEKIQQIQKTFVQLLPGAAGVSTMRLIYEQPLHILMGVVILVLLIACANLANFLLAKAASREREFSTRLALGSSRSRIIRQILTETLLLSSIGGALGLFLAFFGTRFLINFVTGQAHNSVLSATPDLRVLAFTFGLSILTALLFGIAPALRISRISVAPTLTSNARTAAGSGGRSSRLFPNLLVTIQIMLSLMLLAGAGLFFRTFYNLRNQDFGFNRTNILVVQFNAKFAGYKPEQLNGLYDRILSRLDAIPGVQSATISGVPAINLGNWGSPIDIKGSTPAPGQDLNTLMNRVSMDYFKTLNIPVIQGRPIESRDTANSPRIVVVNQTMASHFFPRGDAIGHSFTVGDPSVKGEWQIAGIVRDTKYGSPRDSHRPMIYLPVAQLTGDDSYAYSIQLRTTGDPAKAATAVRSALAGIDPNLPLLEVKTMGTQIESLMSTETLISQLSTFFSLLALSLACIGLYGVMTYNVVRRTNEIGIRIALGAQSTGVLWMVLKESLLLLAIGIALGIPATLAATHTIQSQLFGLSSTDPLTLIAAALVISLVILIAAWFPAHRAAKVDPIIALRYE